MALCLAESLIITRYFDPKDQIERYLRRYHDGHLSVNGECFDIGNTTRQALMAFEETGEPYSGPDHEYSAGNGSLMRLAPVPGYWEEEPLLTEIDQVACGSFKNKEPPEIRGRGFVVKSLEIALWAFYKSDTFEEGCLLAVNLGEDADTLVQFMVSWPGLTTRKVEYPKNG